MKSTFLASATHDVLPVRGPGIVNLEPFDASSGWDNEYEET
jgi:hypothetical protein